MHFCVSIQKNRSCLMLKTMWLVAVVFALGTGAAYAQQAEVGEQAFSKPISGTLIRLEVQISADRVIKGMVEEGGMFRVTDASLGLAVGLVPLLHEDSVKVKVYEISKHPSGGGEVVRYREEVELTPGTVGVPKKLQQVLELKVQEIIRSKAPEQPKSTAEKSMACVSQNQSTLRLVTAFGCCVTCGGTTSCGCAVEDSCGSCCAGPCCRV